jgi:hypothetical protein
MAAGPASVALLGVGTAISAYGQYGQYKAQRKADAIRQRQVQLEATRQRREQLRRGQVARAQATARAYNQGAGDSSALAGGTSQITAQTGRAVTGTNQDAELSAGLFGANAEAAKAGAIVSIGEGISSVGGAIGSNADTLNRASTSLFGSGSSSSTAGGSLNYGGPR